MDFYRYILDTLPHRNDTEKVGIGTALSALFGHPHPRDPDVQPADNDMNDVLSKLRETGHGRQVDSWVGTGQNEPIEPSALERALGRERVENMANHSGMSVQQLLPLLAQYLPMLVDRMTPNGQVPQQGGVMGALRNIFR